MSGPRLVDFLADDDDDTPVCESCGAYADVRLGDGSTWCEDCDTTARRLGYDDEDEQSYIAERLS